jgi:hypothetical protein
MVCGRFPNWGACMRRRLDITTSRSSALDVAARLAFVAGEGNNRVAVMDLESVQVAVTVPVGEGPDVRRSTSSRPIDVAMALNVKTVTSFSRLVETLAVDIGGKTEGDDQGWSENQAHWCDTKMIHGQTRTMIASLDCFPV